MLLKLFCPMQHSLELEHLIHLSFLCSKTNKTLVMLADLSIIISLDEFLQEQQNVNTKKKITNDLKLFQSYLNSQNESRYPQFIPPCELDDYISGFLLPVCKREGTEFELSTVRSFISWISCHLSMNGYKLPVKTDAKFRRCREILTAKQKQLKSTGKGTNTWQLMK